VYYALDFDKNRKKRIYLNV